MLNNSSPVIYVYCNYYLATDSSIQYVSGVPSDFTSTPAPTGYNQYQFTQNAMASGAFGVAAEYHGAHSGCTEHPYNNNVKNCPGKQLNTRTGVLENTESHRGSDTSLIHDG